ncbi:MAG TPA: hypothetical protein VGO64_08385 [Candidatus Limnocylindrales bacterium]|jgi:hypothetical protein|nr:hypothetical protein [Candidatus Limnocylindrales bacterium]
MDTILAVTDLSTSDRRGVLVNDVPPGASCVASFAIAGAVLTRRA